jgi:cyclin H
MTADMSMNGEECPSNARKPLYEGGTQYRHWRFSPEQLADTRTSLNAAAVAVIRDAFESDLVSL